MVLWKLWLFVNWQEILSHRLIHILHQPFRYILEKGWSICRSWRPYHVANCKLIRGLPLGLVIIRVDHAVFSLDGYICFCLQINLLCNAHIFKLDIIVCSIFFESIGQAPSRMELIISHHISLSLLRWILLCLDARMVGAASLLETTRRDLEVLSFWLILCDGTHVYAVDPWINRLVVGLDWSIVDFLVIHLIELPIEPLDGRLEGVVLFGFIRSFNFRFGVRNQSQVWDLNWFDLGSFLRRNWLYHSKIRVGAVLVLDRPLNRLCGLSLSVLFLLKDH